MWLVPQTRVPVEVGSDMQGQQGESKDERGDSDEGCGPRLAHGGTARSEGCRAGAACLGSHTWHQSSMCCIWANLRPRASKHKGPNAVVPCANPACGLYL